MARLTMILKSRWRAYLACGAYMATCVLWPSFSKKHNGKTRVIVFHHVDEESHFAKIIAAIQKRYHIISFDDYLKGTISTCHINIIIALDDGYRSWFTNARPVFQKFNVTPLLFVSADFINCNKKDALAFCHNNILTWAENSLSWEELKILAREGAEIGGHSLGHKNLIKTPCKECFKIIKQDKEEIENALGFPIRSFSYPFGLYNDEIAAITHQAGYHYGFTSDSGWLDDSKGPMFLRRTNIGQRSPLVVEAFIEGWAEWVSKIVAKIKGRKVL